jgi:hypothetical protein
MIELRAETLKEFSLEAASQFIGERIILLMPSLRAIFVKNSPTDQQSG